MEISLIKGANYLHLTASAYVGLCLSLCQSVNQPLPFLRYNLIIRRLFSALAALALEVSLSIIIIVLELVLEFNNKHIIYELILDS